MFLALRLIYHSIHAKGLVPELLNTVRRDSRAQIAEMLVVEVHALGSGEIEWGLPFLQLLHSYDISLKSSFVTTSVAIWMQSSASTKTNMNVGTTKH